MVIAVLSGKGGTGKTTITAALSELIPKVIKADCDVDAPNLYLFYQGTDFARDDFYGGKKAVINKELCRKCGSCEEICKFQAIKNLVMDPLACEGCGACTLVCPEQAIALKEEKTAETFLTRTDKGIISRAVMEPGSDGSGKLVTCLRNQLRPYEEKDGITLVDGSPGIGCSVIASITGTDAVLVVTEPTKSGLDDLKRILTLAENFKTIVMICINKYDINHEMTMEIEKYANENNKVMVGKIPFDPKVMESVNSLKPITRFENSPARGAIEEMWRNIKKIIEKSN